MKARLAVLALLASMFIPLAYAVPTLMDFQGKLTDKNNNAQTGEFSMSFAIYDSLTGGALLWQEGKQVNVSSGLFSTLLGSTTPLNLSFNQSYYVSVTIGGETFSPRYQMTTSAYAFRANISDTAMAINTTIPSFIVRAITSQISNLTEWRNATGAVVAGIDAEGRFYGNGSGLIGVSTTGTTNVSLNYGYNGSNFVPLLTDPAGTLRLSVLEANAQNASNLKNDVNGTNLFLTGNLTVLRNLSVGTTTLFVDQALGRVGVGTATPGYTLEVAGTANITGGLNVSAGGLNVIAGNVGIGTVTPSAKLDITGTDTTNNISLAVNNTLYVNASGNVGIGTTNSGAAKLVIDTASNTAGLRLLGTVETSEIADMYVDGTGALILSTVAGTDSQAFIDLRSEDDNYGLILRESDGTGTSVYANFYVVDAAIDYMNIIVGAAQSTTGLVIQNGGNVGIGTTSPGNTLHVVGTANITGGLNVTTGGLNVIAGNVGIGTTGPTQELTVVGDINVTGTAVGNFGPVRSYAVSLANASNTVSEISIISFTVPANTWGNGEYVTVMGWVLFKNNKGSSGTLSPKMYVDGTSFTLSDTAQSDSATEQAVPFRATFQRVGSELWVPQTASSDSLMAVRGEGGRGFFDPAYQVWAGWSADTFRKVFTPNFAGDIVINWTITPSASHASFYVKPQIAIAHKFGV